MFKRYQILAFLYFAMAIYVSILRKPFVITIFDLTLLSVLFLDFGRLSFRSKIPTDKNLFRYLMTLLFMMIIHMDLAASLKEIIQMIEVYLFYIVLVSYLQDSTHENSDIHQRFLKSFTNVIFIGLIVTFINELFILSVGRNQLHFLAIPLMIISVLTFFYQSQIRIGILSNRFSASLIAFFALAVLFYENSRAGLLFFVIFVSLLALQVKKRYLIPIVTLAVVAVSIFTYVQDVTQTEAYMSVGYSNDGRLVYKENLSVRATRGLGSIQVILENLDTIWDFITAPDQGILTENIYGSNYERLFQVKYVYQAFMNSPIIGLGPNNAAEIANVHGIILVTIADFGLIGIGILTLYIINSYRKLRVISRTKELYDMFLFYYFIYSLIVLAFVSAGLLPLIPFIFVSTLIHIRYHALSFRK